jgi:hypothetical protein
MGDQDYLYILGAADTFYMVLYVLKRKRCRFGFEDMNIVFVVINRMETTEPC